jgi:hypothetical protein
MAILISAVFNQASVVAESRSKTANFFRGCKRKKEKGDRKNAALKTVLVFATVARGESD